MNILFCIYEFGQIEQHLYVEVLKHLTKEMAQNLFQNSIVPLGARVEFFFQWSKWMKNIDQRVETTADHFESQSNQTFESSQPEPISTQSKQINDRESNADKPVVPLLSNQEPITLKTILNSNAYGKNLMKAVESKQNKVLNENLRKILCEAINQYYVERERDLTKKDCESLSKQICKIFPGELAVHHLLLFFQDLFSPIKIII